MREVGWYPMQQTVWLGCGLCVPGNIPGVAVCAAEWRFCGVRISNSGLGSADTTPDSTWYVRRKLRGPALPALSAISAGGLLQLCTHDCEVRKMFWNLLLSFSKVCWPSPVPGLRDLRLPSRPPQSG